MTLRSSNPLDRIRENYRRQEARSPRAPAEPTPERQGKAAGVGYKKVGQRDVRKLLTTIDISSRTGICRSICAARWTPSRPWPPTPWRLPLTTPSSRRPG
jgi:hypothetical protein